MEHVEAGLVGGEPGPLGLHSAERANGDPAVRFPAPGAAPVLQLQHFGGSFLDEDLHGVLVAKPVAAGDGIVGVFVQAVSALMTAAAPPSAETVWLRMG